MIPPIKRRPPAIKMRAMRETAWWVDFTRELFGFILDGPARSWTEIRAWGRARAYTDVTISNMVAFLDLHRLICDAGVPKRSQWIRRPDDGSRPCEHTLMSCDRCDWVQGFPFGERAKVVA